MSASLSTPILAPNPPPTSGATTRIFAGSRPSAVRMNREICAFWVLAQTVSFPSFHSAATGASLEGHRGEPLVDELAGDDHLAAVEGRVVSRESCAHGDVGAGVREQQRLPGKRAVEADHGGQRRIVHADQFGGVFALVPVVGDDDGDWLANETHPVDRQQRLRPFAAERKRRALGTGHPAVRRRRRQVVHVGNGQHRDHPWRVLGRRGVDPGDDRVGDRTAHEGDPRSLSELRYSQVIDVRAALGQQPRILGPDHPGA